MSTLTLPGFANAHSHAFQRLMRGQAQTRDLTRPESSFWTWREAMYGLANRLSLEEIEAAARLTYLESLESGYTAVGEFHYLHHQPDGQPYPDPVATARAHIRAARTVGLRLNLLYTVYHLSGFESPLRAEQRRFLSPSLQTVEEAIQALLEERANSPETAHLVQIGLAIHSVRAVPETWFGPLVELAQRYQLKLHVHASEQQAEVKASIAHTGQTPIGLLDRHGVLGPQTTIVHGTWLSDGDLARLADSQSIVCVCPSTEGDLGDGFAPISALFTHGVRLCIGSDSHILIDPLAELRALEHLGRMGSEERVVLRDTLGRSSPALLACGSEHGFESLGFDQATLEDKVVIDTSGRRFQDVAPEFHRDVAIFSGHSDLVRDVFVAGRQVVKNGRWCGPF